MKRVNKPGAELPGFKNIWDILHSDSENWPVTNSSGPKVPLGVSDKKPLCDDPRAQLTRTWLYRFPLSGWPFLLPFADLESNKAAFGRSGSSSGPDVQKCMPPPPTSDRPLLCPNLSWGHPGAYLAGHTYFQPSFSLLPTSASVLSRIRLFATPWIEACQAPLAMEFSKQEFPPPGPPTGDVLNCALRKLHMVLLSWPLSHLCMPPVPKWNIFFLFPLPMTNANSQARMKEVNYGSPRTGDAATTASPAKTLPYCMINVLKALPFHSTNEGGLKSPKHTGMSLAKRSRFPPFFRPPRVEQGSKNVTPSTHPGSRASPSSPSVEPELSGSSGPSAVSGA